MLSLFDGGKRIKQFRYTASIFNLVILSVNPPSSSNQPMLWFALSPRRRTLTFFLENPASNTFIVTIFRYAEILSKYTVQAQRRLSISDEVQLSWREDDLLNRMMLDAHALFSMTVDILRKPLNLPPETRPDLGII